MCIHSESLLLCSGTSEGTLSCRATIANETSFLAKLPSIASIGQIGRLAHIVVTRSSSRGTFRPSAAQSEWSSHLQTVPSCVQAVGQSKAAHTPTPLPYSQAQTVAAYEPGPEIAPSQHGSSAAALPPAVTSPLPHPPSLPRPVAIGVAPSHQEETLALSSFPEPPIIQWPDVLSLGSGSTWHVTSEFRSICSIDVRPAISGVLTQ